MQNQDIIWDANYWARRLQETSDRIAPILRQIQLDCHSTKNLSVEDQYRLADALSEYASYSRLLKDDLDQHARRPPVPFWKKLFQK